MILKHLLIIYLLFFCPFVFFAQDSMDDLVSITSEITQITAIEKKKTTHIIEPTNPSTLKATIWPNPSNIGKVRLSIENLPKGLLFIQVFNNQSELIQERTINGEEGTSLNHILSLPDTSGTYSIKLSDTNKIIEDLELEIL